MKILWISHFVPYPPKGGAFQRSYNLISKVGAAHELHLVAVRHKSSTHPAAETANAENALLRHCSSVRFVDGTGNSRGMSLVARAMKLAAGIPLTVSLSECREMHLAVRSLVAKESFNLVHFDTIGLACYLPDVGSIPSVLSHHGAESFMMLRRIKNEPSLVRRLAYYAEGVALRRYEAAHCSHFAANIVVSELDRDLLSETTGHADYVVVPNGVDTHYFYAMPPQSGRRLIFAGRLDQYSNRDGILYFMRETWPLLKQRFPDISIDIIGSNPPPELLASAARDTAVAVRGFVPDVRPHFERATVVVCPIRDGGGTRIKILDSLAMAKPIVSTTIGCEGIDVIPDRHLLVANSPDEFLAKVSLLLLDESVRNRLAANARQLAEDRYSWDRLGQILLSIYKEAVNG